MCESAVLCLLDLISKIFQRNYSCLNPEAFNIQYKNCQNTYLQEKKQKCSMLYLNTIPAAKNVGERYNEGIKH